MKKQKLSVLLVLTVAFAAFTLGLLLGRNSRSGGVTLEVPARLLTEPTRAETHPRPTEETIAFPIDINTAEKEEWMALPGIGEVLAERILAYRASYGNFTAPEELLNVEGIGQKRLEEMLAYITVGG